MASPGSGFCAAWRAAVVVSLLWFSGQSGPAVAAQPAVVPLAVDAPAESRPNRLYLGVGAFNVIPNEDAAAVDNADTTAEGRGEYRFGARFFGLSPLLGIMGNADGGLFGYAAFYRDFELGDFIVTPSAGFGGYVQNDSKDLGGVFEFQVSLEAAYEFDDGTRLGLRMSHISNAYLHEDNPGVESALVTFSVPSW
jgi:lipid A 3-O-deacylase